MSAIDVQNEILEPMQRVYVPPRRMEPEEEQKALLDYVDSLSRHTAEDLRDAWRRVRDTHIRRDWPVPAAFLKVANESRKDRADASGQSKKGDGPSPQELWERWKAVSKSAMAQDAVRRGVAWSLKCAVLYAKKKPEEIDLRELSSGKARAERQAARIQNNEPLLNEKTGKEVRALNFHDRETALSMWGHLQANETRTAAEINYGVPEYAEV